MYVSRFDLIKVVLLWHTGISAKALYLKSIPVHYLSRASTTADCKQDPSLFRLVFEHDGLE